jgi:ribosomal-protein-alanine N-acetyltransferase
MRDASGITIERLDLERDLDAVAKLEAVCFPEPWTAEMRRRELRQTDVARMYVLRLPAHPVAAFCACWLIVDELHINTIAVDPDLRRQGLAHRLMQHVLTESAADGARRATLEVRSSNTAALRLYSRLGFAIRAVRPRYYSHPEEDALILWREEIRTDRGLNPGAEPVP